MKRILLLAILTLSVSWGSPAFGEVTRGSGVNITTSTAENPLQKHRPYKGWYFQFGAGLNVGFNGQPFDTRTKSGAGAGTALDFSVGWLKPGNVLGVAVGLQGLNVSDRYVDYGRRQYMYAHADMLLSAETWLIPYLHLGFAYSKTGSPAGGVGVMAPISFSSSVSLVPDVKVTALRGDLFSDNGAKVGAVVSATLGLRFSIGNKGRRKRAQERINEMYAEDELLRVPDAKPEVSARDTVYIRDTVKTGQARYYVLQEVQLGGAQVLGSVMPVQQVAPVQQQVPVQPQAAPVQETAPAVSAYKAKESAFNRSLSEAVLFETGSYELTFSAKLILNEVADYILQNPGLRTMVEGHTDDVGGDEMNRRLSRNRAEAVLDYLVSRGVNPFSISSVGYGKDRPIVPNTSDENRRRNRRVEIHFSGR